MFKEVPLNEATRLINHGPVVLVTSRFKDKKGITPVAWNMPVDKDPAMIVLEVGSGHFIYDCIMETGDFVVNIPPKAMAKAVLDCGKCSGRDVDKFSKFDLISREAKKVSSPALDGALAYLECELVRDEHLLEKYNLVLGKVKYAEAEEKAFKGQWLFENNDLLTIHHLGNKVFCFPGTELLDLRGKEGAQ